MGQGPVQQPHQDHSLGHQKQLAETYFDDPPAAVAAPVKKPGYGVPDVEVVKPMGYGVPYVVVGSGGLSRKPGYGVPRNDRPYDPHEVVWRRQPSPQPFDVRDREPSPPPQTPPPDRPGRPDGGGAT